MVKNTTSTGRRSGRLNDSKVADRLPEELAAEVAAALRERSAKLKSVVRIYEHFGLGAFGISLASFRRLVRKQYWRDGLEASGNVLRSVIGEQVKDSGILTHQAMVKLINLVLRILEGEEIDISTADLVKLSRIVVEQRRLADRIPAAKSAGESEENAAARAGTLPPGFGEVIQQIYGVKITPPGVAPTNGEEQSSAQETPVQ